MRGRTLLGLANGAARSDAELDALVVQARGVVSGLGDGELDRLGDLARRLMADQARTAGAVLPAHLQRTYSALSDGERQGSRSAVANVVTALVLLGFIDHPGS